MFENKNFPIKPLSEISLIKSGSSIPLNRENEGGNIMYIKVSDMNLTGNEKYLQTSTKYVSEDTAKILFPIGTIIFPKNGGAVGTNKKRISTKITTVDLNTMGVIPKKELINTQYLYAWFLQFDLMSIATGSTLPTINAKTMGLQKVIVPPIELQNQFADFVKHIDKLKFQEIITKLKKLCYNIFNIIQVQNTSEVKK